MMSYDGPSAECRCGQETQGDFPNVESEIFLCQLLPVAIRDLKIGPPKVLNISSNSFEFSSILLSGEKFVPATEWLPQGRSKAGKTWWFLYDIEMTFLHHLCRRSC